MHFLSYINFENLSLLFGSPEGLPLLTDKTGFLLRVNRVLFMCSWLRVVIPVKHTTDTGARFTKAPQKFRLLEKILGNT